MLVKSNGGIMKNHGCGIIYNSHSGRPLLIVASKKINSENIYEVTLPNNYDI